ncbi:hypothetical protein GCM10010387_37170 [Streptomyces inusitatus]|uniref:Uncharacterized protein n=3 Tax=Streptomyces TaxID=1883 RepID=A0A918QBW2_9ACTN|nr:hypothetical protein GCM10010387_37170 [Streptomyces inusitatus]
MEHRTRQEFLSRQLPFSGGVMGEPTGQENILEEIEDLDSLEVLEAEDLDESVAFHAFRFAA